MHQVSRDGGHKALWNGNSEIIYKVGTAMHSVAVMPTPDFHASQPELLFTGAFPNIPGFDFDLAPGGQEFLMLENKAFMQPSTTLTVITDVLERVQRQTGPIDRRAGG